VVGGSAPTIAALTPGHGDHARGDREARDQYNEPLEAAEAPSPSRRVQVTPVFGKEGGGIAARFTF
jgi:hypothetical protein